MKKWMLASLLLAMGGVAWSVAQGQAARNPPPRGFSDERPPPARRNQFRPIPSGGKPRLNPVERWLELVRRHNPGEYERLQELRRNNPDAFRREMEAHLQVKMRKPQEPGGKSRQGGPRPGGAQRISPETRRLMQNPQIVELEKKAHAIAKAYAAAATDAEREQLRQQLREELEVAFDRRLEERRNMLVPLEKKLNELKEMLKEREAQRETIIERRIQDLTQHDVLEW